jgi:hypothetical protein
MEIKKWKLLYALRCEDNIYQNKEPRKYIILVVNFMMRWKEYCVLNQEEHYMNWMLFSHCFSRPLFWYVLFSFSPK